VKTFPGTFLVTLLVLLLRHIIIHLSLDDGNFAQSRLRDWTSWTCHSRTTEPVEEADNTCRVAHLANNWSKNRRYLFGTRRRIASIVIFGLPLLNAHIE
jgi:hypothetical protein